MSDTLIIFFDTYQIWYQNLHYSLLWAYHWKQNIADTDIKFDMDQAKNNYNIYFVKRGFPNDIFW